MKHVFVFNPKSFRDQLGMDVVIDSIGQFFRTQEKSDFSILFSRYPRDAIGLIQKQVEALAQGETIRVYAIGGAGILFDCLNGIIGLPNTELAVVPYGTTNDFILAFGQGKTDLFKDISSLITSPSIPTDLIYTGNNYAMNCCSIGLISAVLITMQKQNIRLGTLLSKFFHFYRFMFSLNALSVVFDKTLITQHYQITIDDTDYSGNYSLVVIANGPYYGGGKFAVPTAVPDDGLLDVALFKSASSLATLRYMEQYIRGKIPSNCVLVQAKKIKVQADEPVWLQLDGEFLKDTSVTVEVVPAAVRIVSVNGLTYKSPDGNKV